MQYTHSLTHPERALFQSKTYIDMHSCALPYAPATCLGNKNLFNLALASNAEQMMLGVAFREFVRVTKGLQHQRQETMAVSLKKRFSL